MSRKTGQVFIHKRKSYTLRLSTKQDRQCNIS